MSIKARDFIKLLMKAENIDKDIVVTCLDDDLDIRDIHINDVSDVSSVIKIIAEVDHKCPRIDTSGIYEAADAAREAVIDVLT